MPNKFGDIGRQEGGPGRIEPTRDDWAMLNRWISNITINDQRGTYSNSGISFQLQSAWLTPFQGYLGEPDETTGRITDIVVGKYREETYYSFLDTIFVQGTSLRIVKEEAETLDMSALSADYSIFYEIDLTNPAAPTATLIPYYTDGGSTPGDTLVKRYILLGRADMEYKQAWGPAWGITRWRQQHTGNIYVMPETIDVNALQVSGLDDLSDVSIT